MRLHDSTRLAAMAVLVGTLACATNTAREADTDETAAARDTTMADTLGGEQNPPGYRGMERDTTIAPTDQEATDTFLENQGTGQAQDTAGYTGMERVDTTGQGQMDTTGAGAGVQDTSGAWGTDTTGAYQTDTTGAYQTDTTGMDQSVNPSGTDTTGWSSTGDTTGYGDTQQNPADTTTSR